MSIFLVIFFSLVKIGENIEAKMCLKYQYIFWEFSSVKTDLNQKCWALLKGKSLNQELLGKKEEFTEMGIREKYEGGVSLGSLVE